MADTNNTITRVIPQDGWSPIICHKVPITQTITNIVGDKGPNEIYEGGSIKNFHAKIHVQDQYGGSRVPADIITESSDDYGETWTTNEVQEHYEGDFELDYEGHERDFEVRLSGTSLYIRYRQAMNGQEIADTDGSFEHVITVTDYPVKLEVKAHYADNFGGHEIGANTFESATVFYKSGATASKTVGQLTKPTQTGANAVKWVDKDGWQSQIWSYTENGVTVTAQVGANITALRDTKIEAELYIPDTWSNEDGKDYWYKTVGGSSSSSGVTLTRVFEDGEGNVLLKTNITSIPDNVTDTEGFYNIYFGSGDEDYLSIAKGSIIIDIFEATGVDDYEAFYFGAVEDFIESSGIEEGNVEFFWDSALTIPITVGPAPEPIIIFREGATVSKSNLTVTMTRNDDSTYTTTDYWMPNNYALGRQNQSVTVQKGPLSTTLPVTVAYVTKIEVGSIDEESEEFIKSSFYESSEYVEPDHYRAHYECYDETEGFDEVDELAEGQWEGRIQKLYTDYPYSGGGYFLRACKLQGVSDDDWDESSEAYLFYDNRDHNSVYAWKGSECIEKSEVSGYDDVVLDSEAIYVLLEYEEDYGWRDTNCGGYVGATLLRKDDETLLSIPPLGVASLGEYGSEVGTLTLGSKKYLYKVGLEPIDEENYLFIKDFKNEPFNYGLVKCDEPQLVESEVEEPDILMFDTMPTGPSNSPKTFFAIHKKYVDEEGCINGTSRITSCMACELKDSCTRSTEMDDFLSSHEDYVGHCTWYTESILDPTKFKVVANIGPESLEWLDNLAFSDSSFEAVRIGDGYGNGWIPIGFDLGDLAPTSEVARDYALAYLTNENGLVDVYNTTYACDGGCADCPWDIEAVQGTLSSSRMYICQQESSIPDDGYIVFLVKCSNSEECPDGWVKAKIAYHRHYTDDFWVCPVKGHISKDVIFPGN